MPLQKSIFSKVNKRLISCCGLVILLIAQACTASTHDTPNGDLTLQQIKRSGMTANSPLKRPVDSIVVFKSKREMLVFSKGKKLKTYIISLGSKPEGKKHCEGDRKTPEGRYRINDKNPNSIYHKNLSISYPNKEDLAYARDHKLPPGGEVKIHGLPNKLNYKPEAYLASDWTWGCIAVSNQEIDELYRYVASGSVIMIFP